MEALVTFGPLILIVGVFWLLVLRPAKQRQAQQAQLLSQVHPGARVMTTAGLFGTVTDVTEDELGLEIAPGVTVRYVKQAIAKIVDDPADALDVDDVADVTDHEAEPVDSDAPASGDARNA